MGTGPIDDFAQLMSMRATLDAFLLAVDWAADEWGGDYADPSPARTEWSASPEPWAGDLEDTYRTALARWYAVQDLARGFVAMIDHELPFSTVAASRALAGNAARTWYLVQEGIEPLERVRRLVDERLPDRRLATPEVIAQALGSQSRAAVYCRLTSGVVHGQPADLPRRFHSREADGRCRSRIRPLDGPELAEAVGVAVATLVNAATALAAAAGWDTGALVDAAGHLHRAWDRPCS